MKKLCLIFASIFSLFAKAPDNTIVPDVMVQAQKAYEDGDYTKALQIWEQAATSNHTEAMYNLGILYYKGQGVIQDYNKAREWFEKAVTSGNAQAMYSLGTLYYEGQGVTQDYAKARGWYEKAATLDDAQAMYSLGWLYYKGKALLRITTKHVNGLKRLLFWVMHHPCITSDHFMQKDKA